MTAEAQVQQQETPLTVSQLTQAIKQQLETRFNNIGLQGEISNLKRQASGHIYFSLKDRNAQISAVMFRGNTMGLKALPKDGDQVVVRGEISVYPPRGNYQIIVREMSLLGLGELLMRLEQLKREIKRRGWFEKEHKKPIPKFPKTIGVVTSPTGAAIQDMLNVLTRRFGGFHLIINPAKVQGEGSAEEIARAIQQFNEHGLADVLLVGRGGGSIEDLWAFNEEIVAKAIFESKIPIICAVGHETDHTIAEYVADLRAPTPSAAAEIVLGEKAQLLDKLSAAQRRIQQSIQHLIRHGRQRLRGILRQPAIASPYTLIGPSIQKLDDLRTDIDKSLLQNIQQLKLHLRGRQQQATALNPIRQLQYYRQRLQQLSHRLDLAISKKVDGSRRSFESEKVRRHIDRLVIGHMDLRKERLKHVIGKLESIDPKNLLKKGYSIIFSEKDGSAITSVRVLETNQQISVLLADGKASATIKETYPND